MNFILQNIVAFTALVMAVGFLIKKFLWKKAKTDKGCGTGSDCGCH